MVSGLPTTEKRGFESHQLGGNSGWHLWNHHRIFELKKPGNSWLNSDKELITYQLLADGFRGAYGQIPSDFQKEVRRDSLYPPSKYNFIEIG